MEIDPSSMVKRDREEDAPAPSQSVASTDQAEALVGENTEALTVASEDAEALRPGDYEPSINAEKAASLKSAKEDMLKVGAAAVKTWLWAKGPPFGTCSHCFHPVESPRVLACGHAICGCHTEASSTLDGLCCWAPACSDFCFPAGLGNRSAPALCGVMDALLERGFRAPAEIVTEAVGENCDDFGNTCATRKVVSAKSPLHAIEGYEAIAAEAEATTPEKAAAALARAVQLRDRFALPAPVMASRFVMFRQAAEPRSEASRLRGDCPAAKRQAAEASVLKLVAAGGIDAFQRAAALLPEPTVKDSAYAITKPAAQISSTAGEARLDGEKEMKQLEELLDCAACYASLFEPVALPCGHTFCRRCVARQLDFDRGCPLCRCSLGGFIDCYAVADGLARAVEEVLPGASEQGREANEKEIEDMRAFLPVFVSNLAFPKVECPLHIFEPRYRLMMRRAVTSGIRRFGMCAPINGPPEVAQNGYSKVGTVLFIREMRMLPDGRSLVDCIGEKRFKVKEASMRDGYNVARVDYLDEGPLEEIRDTLVNLCRNNFNSLQLCLARVGGLRGMILRNELGDVQMAEDNEEFFWQTLAILPVSDGVKYQALITDTRRERFEFLVSVLSTIVQKLSTDTTEEDIESAESE